MERLWNRGRRVILCSLSVAVVYFLSYAPFLAVMSPDDLESHTHVGYRSPPFYKPVEWCIVYSSADVVLLYWGDLWGVGASTEIQAFYFAQGAAEPWEFNFLE